MASYEIKNLSFSYPGSRDKALSDISISIGKSEFLCLCGKSGCGKTTLLRLLKTVLSPHGMIEGEILFDGKPLSEISNREQSAQIGFVMQDPESQLVTDKVWHELAFGLESLGLPTSEIRTRVAEMSSFFGIGDWFHKNVNELSGGQKQLLNLASVMVMQPQCIILDEPTSQLDPIAASEFLKVLKKINSELGIAVIISEHRLEEVFPIADRVIVLDSGKIIADGNPRETGAVLMKLNHDMASSLPTPMRVFAAVDGMGEYPIDVRGGRLWLENYSKSNNVDGSLIKSEEKSKSTDVCIELKDVWFRYEKNMPDVIKGASVSIEKGEIFSVLGGNGSGKTTMLSLISGLNTPLRGKVLINGKKLSEIKNIYNGVLGVLSQNPECLFCKATVYDDLYEVIDGDKISDVEKEEAVLNMVSLCRIEHLLKRHPYDLSGGEKQRLALCKVLLKNPEIVLLDEPTKGFDGSFKEIFSDILFELKERGKTIVMVSHDIEFCAGVSDRCAMFFDGAFAAVETPRKFFTGNSFYTTAANRMARTVVSEAVLAEDIISACGKKPAGKKKINRSKMTAKKPVINKEKKKKKLSLCRIVIGSLFVLAFVLLCVLKLINVLKLDENIIKLVAVCLIGGCFICFCPKREQIKEDKLKKEERKLTKRTIVSALGVLLMIPVTIYVGIRFFGDRKYYFISLLIIIETIIPFLTVFEKRRPQARELVIISVLCAIAVCGRTAFFMFQQFKPVLAIIIISGVAFGGETGFLVGVVTGFVSNFFFGQGPWTPWQMFAFGAVGFLGGVLFRKVFLRRTRVFLSVFGFFAAIIIYGGIMNPAAVIMVGPPTKELILAAFVTGFPFDLIHALSTAFFLWFISEPMLEKLERVKMKYGLLN